MLTSKECRPLCRSFFILAQETLRDFIEKIEYVFILGVFLKPFITFFLAIDTSKVLGFLVMQDINKKEGFSHPFFLKFAGFVCKVCQLARCRKSVQATKNLFVYFLVF